MVYIVKTQSYLKKIFHKYKNHKEFHGEQEKKRFSAMNDTNEIYITGSKMLSNTLSIHAGEYVPNIHRRGDWE